ncbi:MAG: amidohydrolase family protein, partial [Gemmatimonadota bacterium]
ADTMSRIIDYTDRGTCVLFGDGAGAVIIEAAANGEDAGFIYQMYGFGLLRELELHQEAGFHPITVIQHATGNNALIMGEATRLGRVRVGHLADLIVVNGNPLADLKVLYPTGVDEIVDGVARRTGGVEWTIKDGITYHGPTLMEEVKAMVAEARRAPGRSPGS